MARKPLSKLKGRLSAAIDWRVRQEFETERDVIMGITETVTTMNIAYEDKISAVERLIEELDRRVRKLEQ